MGDSVGLFYVKNLSVCLPENQLEGYNIEKSKEIYCSNECETYIVEHIFRLYSNQGSQRQPCFQCLHRQPLQHRLRKLQGYQFGVQQPEGHNLPSLLQSEQILSSKRSPWAGMLSGLNSFGNLADSN